MQTAVNTFRQDEKIDTAERDDLMSSMQQGLEAETYTEEEAWIKAISEKYEKSSNGGERIEGFKKLISPGEKFYIVQTRRFAPRLTLRLSQTLT